MVNKFNEQVSKEGKTEVVHAGDPDGTLFLINPDVGLNPLHTLCWLHKSGCIFMHCIGMTSMQAEKAAYTGAAAIAMFAPKN